jgi:hypothetical protein
MPELPQNPQGMAGIDCDCRGKLDLDAVSDGRCVVVNPLFAAHDLHFASRKRGDAELAERNGSCGHGK